MNTLLRFVGAVICALALGASAGYALLSLAPCHWFGSTFEGACGFRALGVATMLGIVVASVSFVLLLRFVLANVSAASAPTVRSDTPRKLVILWVGLFVLDLAAPMVTILLPSWTFDFVYYLTYLPLMALLVTTAFLAPYRGYPSAIALIGLVPLAGVPVVGVLLLLSKSRLVGSSA